MKRAKILASCVALACIGGLSAAQAGLYVGVGGGEVRLDPDLESGIEIEDDGRDSGLKAVIGTRMGRVGRIELFYTDLGTANFTPAAEVDYSSYGINTVWDVWTAKGGKRRPSVFLSLGLGALETEADGASAERGDDLLTLAGIGATFPFRHGLSLRTTIEAYESDASMVNALLIKEFGGRHSKRHGKHKKSKHHQDEMQALPDIESAEVDAVVLANGPAIKKPAEVMETQPVVESAEAAKTAVADLAQLENVYFNRDSAFVTQMSEDTLQQLIQIMADYPAMKVEIQGHASAEEQGSLRALSELRAQRVGNYLWRNGIAPDRLDLIAYGSSQPAAGESGDRLNRRVQFRILSVD